MIYFISYTINELADQNNILDKAVAYPNLYLGWHIKRSLIQHKGCACSWPLMAMGICSLWLSWPLAKPKPSPSSIASGGSAWTRPAEGKGRDHWCALFWAIQNLKLVLMLGILSVLFIYYLFHEDCIPPNPTKRGSLTSQQNQHFYLKF